MSLLSILYWVILVIGAICYLALNFAYTLPLVLLALFIIIGLKVFRTPIQ